MSNLLDTPDRAVENGEVAFGRFKTPFRQLNLLDCNIGGPPLPGYRAFRLKEWEHFAVLHPDFYMSIAVVDVKFMSKSWVFFHDRRSGRSFEHSRQMPLVGLTFPPQLWNGRVSFKQGSYHVLVRNHLESGVHNVTLDIKGSRNRPGITATFVLHEQLDQVQPLIAVLPIGSNRPFYTHKAPCPLSGFVRVGDEEFLFEQSRDIAIIDIHKTFYPRNTFWKWATFATRDTDNRMLGVNLTHNVIQDYSCLNENCIWHGNSISLVGAARFEVPADPTDEWRVKTEDGRVELTLQPQGMRSENINLLLAKSRYCQPVGIYSGFVVDDDGRRHEVSSAFGIAEDHIAVW